MADTHILSSTEEIATAALEVIADTGRELWLNSRCLDAGIFGPPSWGLALSALALRHHKVTIQILLREPQLAARQAPAVIALARRLASRIEIREFTAEQEPPAEEWLLSDGGATLHRGSLEQRGWSYSPHDTARMRRLQARHQELWDRAEVSTELREMRI